MPVTAYPLTFLERRALIFYFTAFFYPAWSIGLGVNLAAKLNTEGIHVNEIRALIFAEAVAAACSLSLLIGGLLHLVSRWRESGCWLSSVQGEVIWVLLLAPFTFFSAIATSISRPFFSCPGTTNDVQLSSCTGVNNGILLIGWLFPLLVFSYFVLILSRARQLAQIYEPFIREQISRAKWEDVAYYQRLRSLQRLNGYHPSRPSTDSEEEPLPRYEPKPEVVHYPTLEAGRLRIGQEPTRPFKPLLMRQIHHPSIPPQYVDLYPQPAQVQSVSTYKITPTSSSESLASSVEQEVIVPKDFRKVPVPKLQAPPLAAKRTVDRSRSPPVFQVVPRQEPERGQVWARPARVLQVRN